MFGASSISRYALLVVSSTTIVTVKLRIPFYTPNSSVSKSSKHNSETFKLGGGRGGRVQKPGKPPKKLNNTATLSHFITSSSSDISNEHFFFTD